MAFSKDAEQRVANATRGWERQTRNDGSGGERARYLADAPRPQVFQFAADLNTGGTAEAYRVTYSKAAGVYTADTSTSYTLTDLLGQFWGVKYEWVLAYPIANDFVVVSHGAPSHIGTISLGSGSGSGGGAGSTSGLDSGEYCDVDIVVRGNSHAVPAYDEFLGSGDSMADGDKVKISYDVHAAKWKIVNAVC